MDTKRPGWYREDSGSGPVNTYYAPDGTVYRCRRDPLNHGWWDIKRNDKVVGVCMTLKDSRSYVEYLEST